MLVYRLSVSQYIMHPFPLGGHINFKWHPNTEPTGPGHYSLQYMYRPSPIINRTQLMWALYLPLKRVPTSSHIIHFYVLFYCFPLNHEYSEYNASSTESIYISWIGQLNYLYLVIDTLEGSVCLAQRGITIFRRIISFTRDSPKSDSSNVKHNWIEFELTIRPGFR